MSKPNMQLSLGLNGMERQSFEHLLDDKVFTFQRNGLIETEDDTVGLTNEMSNLLCSRFKEGKVVIGHKYDLYEDKIYFFLTDENFNSEGKRSSEIGYIKLNSNISDTGDIEQECGCSYEMLLNTPLEEIEQIEHCKYNTLVEDYCNNCLNFNPNFPINDIVIKREHCGLTMSFTDGLNPPRYIILSGDSSISNIDSDYYHKLGEIDCGVDNRIETCLDCDKLRIFPLYTSPCLKPEVTTYGGNLRMGNYEFFIAYCDYLGRETSPYFSATNAVRIFDHNMVSMEQTDIANRTNFGIKLNVLDLDKRFRHYRLAIVTNADVNNVTSYYLDKVRSISETTVSITDDNTWERTTLEHINAEKPIYKTWGGLTTANDYLIGYDYEVEKEWNLQPVVNLMGSLLKWQTVRANENLYKDGVNCALYTGYFRDEVYPFAIRFITNEGYITPLYPLISRPHMDGEMDDISGDDDINVRSILSNKGKCNNNERRYRWQFYNTAAYEQKVSCGDIYSEVLVDSENYASCVDKGFSSIDNGVLEIEINGNYNNLSDWIYDNSEFIIRTVKEKYSDNISEVMQRVCDETNSEYNVSECSLLSLYNVLTDDIKSCPNNWDEDNIFEYPICDDNCGKDTCSPPELFKVDIKPSVVVNEISEKIRKEDSEYNHYKSEISCDQFEIENGDNVLDTSFGTDLKVYKRQAESISNIKCDSTEQLPQQGQYFNVFRFDDKTSLVTEYNSQPNDGNLLVESTLVRVPVKCDKYTLSKKQSDYVFLDKIHKGSRWYSYTFEKDEILLEITPVRKNAKGDDASHSSLMRYTLFTDCDEQFVKSGTFDVDEGLFLTLKKSDYPDGKVIIALDNPIVNIPEEYVVGKVCDNNGENCEDCKKFRDRYIITSPKGCIDINIREVEYKFIKVSFDSITFDKTLIYRSVCKVPQPISSDCRPSEHERGRFAYWESSEIYPSNKQLYDSSKIVMSRSDFRSGTSKSLIDQFESFYVDNNGVNYKWKPIVDFTCENIRHFKFPNNEISPFMSVSNSRMSDSEIYPLGVYIEDEVVQSFLDVAVKNNLITQGQRDSIQKYEIFRGDRMLNKSVVVRGILNDMYMDTVNSKDNNKVLFRNFPYNTLGSNRYLEGVVHPGGSTHNSRFSFISPEVYYNRPNGIDEVTFDGYMYGTADMKFAEVKGHPKWTILSPHAKVIANLLAIAEVALELALTYIQAKQMEDLLKYEMDFKDKTKVVNGSGTVNVDISGKLENKAIKQGSPAKTWAKIGVVFASATLFKYPKYRGEWLRIFEAHGPKYNFAKMYVSSEGKYNYFKPTRVSKKQEDRNNFLRSVNTFKFLKPGRMSFKEVDETDYLVVNNVDRENSLYLSFGKEYPVYYPDEYVRYDNYDLNGFVSSRKIAGDLENVKILGQSPGGLKDLAKDVFKPIIIPDRDEPSGVGNIASPYVTLKNYLPNQYGTIGSIKWLSTNDCCGNGICDCNTIFGGDAVISRVDFKNKMPLFNTTAIKLGNDISFDYRRYFNVGKVSHWVGYKSADESFLGDGWIDNDYVVDQHNTSGKYLRPPSKFYLYTYAVPRFLVESDINCNFRYAGNEPHEQFASNGINVVDWVQEENVSIAFNNIFYYNNAYSKPQTGLAYKVLPDYYDKGKWDCLATINNSVTYSQQDNSEVSLSDPWLVYRPFDKYDFSEKYGRLVNMRTIESRQVIGLFENNAVLFNAIDVIREKLNNAETEEIGFGGMFAQRPVEFSHTDLGETGTQHKAFVSCQFGHYWVDAKRGKIFSLNPNGKGLEIISDFKDGGESGMRKWFKKHLPFKILKGGIDSLSDLDVDNPYKGLGILMWWDDKFKRLFITKLDYIVNKEYVGKITHISGDFYYGNELIKLTDRRFFKDVSWTVAYSPIYKSFISYYDFKPQYAISMNNFFQTGINYANDKSEIGLWSHLLSNKTYQVFYGKYYPWEIEVPIKNTFTNNVLNNVNLWTFSRRYHDNDDYAIWRYKSFNKAIIYNQTNNSGVLKLDYVDRYNKSDYPKKDTSISQVIPVTHFDNKINFNYFYNRVYNIDNHVPIWKHDDNDIHKQINSKAISFNNKPVLERLRGDWFKVYLRMDHSSQFQQVFKWMLSNETSY